MKRIYARPLRWLLDFPVFYKVLVANTALAVTVALIGSWLWTRYAANSVDRTIHWEFTAWFVAAALLAGVLVNYAILRAALQPLSELNRLVEALRRGHMDARAERPLFADRLSMALMETTNGLLDELAGYEIRVADMSERITEQLETERNNIARELHDDTAQSLVTLLVLEQMIARATTEEDRVRAIEDARSLTRHTLEGVRRMSIGLHPAILDDAGLPGALRWYVEELMGAVLPAKAKLDLDGTIKRLPQVAELALYRIAQEALSNVARHSRAGIVSVSLRREANEVLLQITDDGIGFEAAAPPADRREHLGLFTITERARLAGGVAEVISEPGRGTTVVVRLPLRGAR